MIERTTVLLSPVPVLQKASHRLNDRLSTLSGMRVGIWDNFLWANFGRFADRLEELLRTEIGVARVARLAGADATSNKWNRISDTDWNAFVTQIDTAIVGLGA